ncbi:putative zinc finger protein [Orchesella cincta]|uniref:Putative zinc finger protein n=1 Tax=Orchesella cincta TaxID=48709 RepID=A0A1D2MZC7_ORCCI|nr:putative zinc finger protein [Orchesella cincta]
MNVCKSSSRVIRRKSTRCSSAALLSPKCGKPTNGASPQSPRSPQPVLTQSVQPPSPEAQGSGPKLVMVSEVLVRPAAGAVENAGSESPSTPVLEAGHDNTTFPSSEVAQNNILQEVERVKQVYQSATHSHLIRRNLTDKDWKYIHDHLTRLKSKVLKTFINCSEKLTQIFCVKCDRLVDNGKSGFLQHLQNEHPGALLRIPCEICGIYIHHNRHETHWINHFFPYCCKVCDKGYAVEKAFTKHITTHLKRNLSKDLKPKQKVGVNADRRWKCNICGNSYLRCDGLLIHIGRKHAENFLASEFVSELQATTSLLPPSQDHNSNKGISQNDEEQEMEQDSPVDSVFLELPKQTSSELPLAPSEPQTMSEPAPQPPKQIEVITLDDDDDNNKVPKNVENNTPPFPFQGISV